MLCLLALPVMTYAQNAGFFGTPLSSIIYNDGNPQDQTADVFNGSDLGLITSLELNGARIETFKDDGAELTAIPILLFKSVIKKKLINMKTF
jgi:hypothetical protein